MVGTAPRPEISSSGRLRAWGSLSQRAARDTVRAAQRPESRKSEQLEAAGGQRYELSICAGPRRLAPQEARPAGIPIVELPPPLGRASPALLAGTPGWSQDQGGEAELRCHGWPALAGHPRIGRRRVGAGRPLEVPPNTRLLLTPPLPPSSPPIIESVRFGYTAAQQKRRALGNFGASPLPLEG